MSANRGRISIGNAENFIDGPTRGWFVGSFLDRSAGPGLTDQVEVKWGRHEAGEQRPGVADSGGSSSLTILVSGRFELLFPGEDPGRTVLEHQGDFALYGPGVPHTWRALEPSVILTVRWRPALKAPTEV